MVPMGGGINAKSMAMTQHVVRKEIWGDRKLSIVRKGIIQVDESYC